MIDNQLARRNLTDGWRLEYAMNKKELLLKIGREKQSHGETAPGKTLLSLNDKSVDKHNTQKDIASSLNWSTGKVAQAEVVRKEAPEIWESVKSGNQMRWGETSGLSINDKPDVKQHSTRNKIHRTFYQ